MVIRKKRRFLLCTILSLFSLLMLTGCPWERVKYYPAETASVDRRGDAVCFLIPDEQDYQPVFISINRRGTPNNERTFTENPALYIVDGQFCIPPSFYHFSDDASEPFIINLVLHSQKENRHPREFVVAFKVLDRQVYNVPLTTREYDEPETNREKQ